MTTSQKMFLIAAEEKNFSRAAEKAFVTPQCLSDHIKRLEEQYQVTLFQRRPHLQLTAEGETLLRYLNRIQALEDGLTNELADIRGGIRGTIRLGVPTTRGVIIVAKVAAEFQKRFPNVDIQVRYGDTQSLEELLLAGKLDIFLGVDAKQHVLFRRRSLCSEPLYLVISQDSMKRRFGQNYENVRRDFLKNQADLELLQDVPFVQGDSRSTTTMAFRQFMLKNRIHVQIPLQSSNFDVLAELCKTGYYATVCSRFYIRRLIDLENQRKDANPIHVYLIRHCSKRLVIEMITQRDAPELEYFSAFSKIMEQTITAENESVYAWLTQKAVVS